MQQNVDYLQSHKIVEHATPITIKGKWTRIECVTALTNVVIVTDQMEEGSEPWQDKHFPLEMIRELSIKEITFQGEAILYA